MGKSGKLKSESWLACHALHATRPMGRTPSWVPMIADGTHALRSAIVLRSSSSPHLYPPSYPQSHSHPSPIPRRLFSEGRLQGRDVSSELCSICARFLCACGSGFGLGLLRASVSVFAVCVYPAQVHHRKRFGTLVHFAWPYLIQCVFPRLPRNRKATRS